MYYPYLAVFELFSSYFYLNFKFYYKNAIKIFSPYFGRLTNMAIERLIVNIIAGSDD
jgi:hypothetical protein